VLVENLVIFSMHKKGMIIEKLYHIIEETQNIIHNVSIDKGEL